MFGVSFNACLNSSTDSTPSAITGSFQDSAVSGLNYNCSSDKSGITNTLGEYTCNVEDTVEFKIAGISLGTVNVESTITPLTFFPSNETATVNLAQLLQTLDSDNNANNGITLDPKLLALLKDNIIDFTSDTFDTDVAYILGKTLVNETDAINHLNIILSSLGLTTIVIPNAVLLESIRITNPQSALRVSQSVSLNLVGVYSDGTTKDVSNQAIFHTDNTQIVSVYGNTIEALAIGTVSLYATIGNITSNSILMTINKLLDTNNFSLTNFGSTYTNIIPGNSTKNTYDEKLFCMITGKILAEDGNPLSGVKVTIHNHPEYGSLLTDNNGKYAFASEGGTYLTMRYSANGFTTIDRKIYAPVKEWSIAPSVTMLEVDTKVTTIMLGTTAPLIHTSTPIVDDRGERSTTLVFNNISNATVTSADGTTRNLTKIAVRATEFKTPKSMPADLPTQSAYTYCSDLQVDGVGDDENITFNAPVIMYVDNFLGFDIGEIVPIGYYDRNDAKWKASKNGVVIQLLDTDGDGIVDALDSNGDSLANDLNNNGSFVDEVAGIQNNSNYIAGKSYWRAEITHFTPWDHNWPYGPPDDAKSPDEPDVEDQTPPNDCNIAINSYVTAKTRVFHEDIPVAGTDTTLHYSSKRVDGYIHVIDASIDTTNIPASVIGVSVKLEVAGRVFKKEPAISELGNLQFKWDGKDILGNKVTGDTTAKLTVSYKYQMVYYRASSQFAQAWANAGSSVMGIRGRDDIDLSVSKSINIKVENTTDNNSNLAKGWTLSNVNYLGVNSISKGNGTKVEKEISLEDGLVAYYRFEGNAEDISGKNNHGVANSGVSYVDGIIGKAAKFNGINGSILVKQSSSLNNLKEITLSFWTKYNKYDSGSGNVSTHIANGYDSPDGIFNYSIENGIFYYLGRTGNAIRVGLELNATIPLQEQKFIFVTFVADKTTIKMYKNGILVDEKARTISQISRPYYDWTIGSMSGRYNLDGLIDDLRIYDKALNSEHINAIYNYGSTGVTGYNYDSYKISDNNLEYTFGLDGKHLFTKSYPDKKTLESYIYDENGNLISITDNFTNTITITRDTNGNPTLITAPNGQETYLNVDANGDLISVKYEDSSSYQFEYDSGSLMTKEIDPNGNVFTHLFDANGRIYQDTDAIGGNWKFMKNNSGKIATYTMTKPEGDETSSTDTKQADGSTISVRTLPSGDTISSTISADKKQISLLKGGVSINTLYTTDVLNEQKILSSKSITQVSGLKKQIVYTSSYDGNQTHTNSKTQTISTNSKVTTIVSDYNNAVDTITSPELRTLKREYDKDTLLTTSISLGTLEPTTYEYNTQGKVIKETTGARIINYTYDDKGNIETITNPKGETTNYTYDIMDRVNKITYANGTTQQYKYDFNGNISKLITPSPTNHTFAYNGIDKRVNHTSPLNKATKYTYNKNRKVSSIVKPSTRTISNTYTKDRLVSTNTPEGTTSYTYLFANIITTITNASESINYTYDGELLTSLTQSGILNQSINYSYNNDFLVKSTTYAGTTNNYTYDKDTLLTSSGDFTLTRDKANGYTTKVTDNTFTQNISYNNYGEVTSVSDNTFSYELSQRDKTGTITQKKETINGVSTRYDYTYDNRGRLTNVSKDNINVENYTYDNNGNRLQATVYGVTTSASYTLDDNLEVYGDATYRYDEDGYLVQKTSPTQTTAYTYNTLGALTKVTTPTQTINYHLNALNQRVAKEVNNEIVEKYLWLNLTTLLAIYDKDDKLIQRYNYTNNRMPTSMTQNKQTYYLHYDQVGTLKLITDKNHNIIKEVTYDTFGNILNDTNKNLNIPFGFAGGLQDKDTNLVHFGYREYDPHTGKWTAKDPIDFQGGDANLYGYVLGDPVNFVDPEGLWVPQIIGAAVGLLIEASNQRNSGKLNLGRLAMAGLTGAWGGFGGFAGGVVRGALAAATNNAYNQLSGQCSSLNFGDLTRAAGLGATGGFFGGLVGKAGKNIYRPIDVFKYPINKMPAPHYGTAGTAAGAAIGGGIANQ
ncbi:RHS repeat-associated core domain-containing protein [Sulfurimonas sp.]|uniref:RHS repeat-associated core domain-containing protein n=1 Tax=Sulfurimonas sp. TaxID=2022749 RepID=UPI002B481CD1|nr:RHS repeat-associated core domain-containing protein [Sulfurimonas sp.]